METAMGNPLRAYARKLRHFPVLLIASGITAVLLVIGLVFVLSDFVNTVSWYVDMLRWYLGDLDYLFANFGDVTLNGLYLLANFLNIFCFCSIPVLLGLYLLFATDCIEPTRTNTFLFLICAAFSLNIALALYTYVTGCRFLGNTVSMLTYLQNLFPANITALVVAGFLIWFFKKGRAVDFAPALLAAGFIEVAFAVLHITGSIMRLVSDKLPVTLFGVTEWMLDLIVPLLFVFLGFMIIKKIKRVPSRFGGYIVNRINAVQLSKKANASESRPEEAVSVEKTPEKEPVGQI